MVAIEDKIGVFITVGHVNSLSEREADNFTLMREAMSREPGAIVLGNARRFRETARCLGLGKKTTTDDNLGEESMRFMPTEECAIKLRKLIHRSKSNFIMVGDSCCLNAFSPKLRPEENAVYLIQFTNGVYAISLLAERGIVIRPYPRSEAVS